jgi:hypothetical protein
VDQQQHLSMVGFSQAIPDIYADGVNIQAGYAGFTLIFTRTTTDPAAVTPVGIIRLSPQQALIMTDALRKGIATYRKEIGDINVPDALYEQLGIERET